MTQPKTGIVLLVDQSRVGYFTKGEKFIRAMPRGCVVAACKLEGKSIQVALVCWYLKGLNSRKNLSDHSVVLSAKMLREFGINRSAAYRALKKLEAANLVSVDRRRGRLPRITILKVDGSASPPQQLTTLEAAMQLGKDGQ